MVPLDSCLETESNDWESGNKPNTSDEMEQQIELVSKMNTKWKGMEVFQINTKQRWQS